MCRHVMGQTMRYSVKVLFEFDQAEPDTERVLYQTPLPQIMTALTRFDNKNSNICYYQKSFFHLCSFLVPFRDTTTDDRRISIDHFSLFKFFFYPNSNLIRNIMMNFSDDFTLKNQQKREHFQRKYKRERCRDFPHRTWKTEIEYDRKCTDVVDHGDVCGSWSDMSVDVHVDHGAMCVWIMGMWV